MFKLQNTGYNPYSRKVADILPWNRQLSLMGKGRFWPNGRALPFASSFSVYGLKESFGIYINKPVPNCKTYTVQRVKMHVCASGRGRVCWHPELVFLLCQILIMLKWMETLPRASAGRWFSSLSGKGWHCGRSTIAHPGLTVALQSPFYRCFLFISKSTYINIAKTNSLMLLHFKGTLTWKSSQVCWLKWFTQL